MARIFGFEFFKGNTPNQNEETQSSLKTFAHADDVASYVLDATSAAGGLVSFNLLHNSIAQTERELLKTYREMAKSAEVGLVLNEIRNETFIFDDLQNRAIDIRFYDDSNLSDQLKEKISEEFDNVYDILKFKDTANELLESFYVDSKLFLHKIVDPSNKKAGIKKIIKIDPAKIRKIKEVPDFDSYGLYDLNQVKEYYVYSEQYDVYAKNNQNNISRAQHSNNVYGLKIGIESIAYIDSGVYDRDQGIVLGQLYKAIAPYNNLKLMEESLLIYRVARSPERRVFYIDIGNLPNNKAEQYLKEMMNKFRNKLSYDSKTGTLLDKSSTMSMVEDYWIPIRAGSASAGTHIDTLQSGDSTGIIADVTFFKEKFLSSLNIPLSRFQSESTIINYGSTNTEITRDEYRFKRFIDTLRKQFSKIFEDLLKTQLLLKNIITLDDWDEINSAIFFVYNEDNNFVEAKELEILNKRLDALDKISSYVGKYFSQEYVWKNILKFSDEQIEMMKSEIESGKSKKSNKKVDDLNSENPEDLDILGSETPENIDNQNITPDLNQPPEENLDQDLNQPETSPEIEPNPNI